MVITVLTDDFLRKIRLANLDILSVARCCDSHDIAVALNLEAESAENVENILCRDLDAEDLVDAAQCCGKFLSFLRCSRIHIECARCDLAAAEFLDQVKGTRHTDLNGVLRDAFFVVAGCVCVLSETSRSFTDVVAHELCGFKEKLCRILCDLTVHSAHDTRKGNRLASVADHKVILV